jgi:hypothetical protein
MGAVAEATLAPAVAEALLADCLGAFSRVRLQVTGTCMTPALAEGDTVLLAPTRERPPRLGDVVLVRVPEGLRLHRLVFAPPRAVPGLRYRTQADRGGLWDPAVEPGAVLATVLGVKRTGSDTFHPTFDPGRALRSLWRAIYLRAAMLVGQKIPLGSPMYRGMRTWLSGRTP